MARRGSVRWAGLFFCLLLGDACFIRRALGTWVRLFPFLVCGVCVWGWACRVALVWLVLASGCWVRGAGIGRISWSMGLAWALPSGVSMF